ncbi:MAG: M23 family metallopeptidase [Clostridia bacterium]|nr:M23 family metallopeptidase [Clostridia bacterium]
MNYHKRRVTFILSKQIKYYTKKTFKLLILIAIALLIIFFIFFSKYQLVCEVSIAGENIGYVKDKNVLEDQIQELYSKEGTENIAFVDFPEVPEYRLTFVSHDKEINDTEVLAKIEESAKVTYEYYAVTLNGKEQSVVASLDEAEKIVAEMKEKYKDSVKFTIGINKLHSENGKEYSPVTLASAEKKVSTELHKMESSSVNGVYLAQKPITGIITSRFGSMESIRSFPHNGLDIAAPYGTKIKSATDGKVIFSGWQGSYGNLVIVDCGNGVKIYYGHCSKLLTKAGTKVKAGDILAEVGSTGNSNGNHLHFEIQINGISVNPQKYIYK